MGPPRIFTAFAVHDFFPLPQSTTAAAAAPPYACTFCLLATLFSTDDGLVARVPDIIVGALPRARFAYRGRKVVGHADFQFATGIFFRVLPVYFLAYYAIGDSKLHLRRHLFRVRIFANSFIPIFIQDRHTFLTLKKAQRGGVKNIYLYQSFLSIFLLFSLTLFSLDLEINGEIWRLHEFLITLKNVDTTISPIAG